MLCGASFLHGVSARNVLTGLEVEADTFAYLRIRMCSVWRDRSYVKVDK